MDEAHFIAPVLPEISDLQLELKDLEGGGGRGKGFEAKDKHSKLDYLIFYTLKNVLRGLVAVHIRHKMAI